ncbi:MAG: hypothetical protein LBD75_07160 [Candidatus Peribacteria bacterium]|nr:hypothetical protein [Candidatus Peribacteria bacterium]
MTTVSSLGIVESVDVFQDFVYCGIYVQDKGAAAALYKLDVKKPLDSQLLGIMNQEGRYAH